MPRSGQAIQRGRKRLGQRILGCQDVARARCGKGDQLAVGLARATRSVARPTSWFMAISHSAGVAALSTEPSLETGTRTAHSRAASRFRAHRSDRNRRAAPLPSGKRTVLHIVVFAATADDSCGFRRRQSGATGHDAGLDERLRIGDPAVLVGGILARRLKSSADSRMIKAYCMG